MISPRALARRASAHRNALIAVVAVSALVFGVSTTAHAVRAESAARAKFTAEIDATSSSISGRLDVGRAVVASHLKASVCVADVTQRIAPAIGGGSRFTTATLGRASVVLQRSADAAPVPVFDPASPPAMPDAAGVDELKSALDEFHAALDAAEREVASLASAARATEQQCESALAAESALIAEVRHRSDEFVAANPKAAADAVSALAAARDAVVADDPGALERWITAVGAVESSHAGAVQAEAEAEAEEAARQAVLAAEADRDVSNSGPLTFFDPNLPPSPPRALSDEEFCELVPSACTNGVPTPLPLD